MEIIETDKSYLSISSFSNTELLNKCVKEIETKLIENPEIIVYGKKCNQHRSIGFFSNSSIGYYYSGKLMSSQKLTKSLEELLEYINKEFNVTFNGILVNQYNSGLDYISKHSDDESNLSDIGVVCISHGAIRKFRIRDKNTNKILLDVPTKPYEIMHMGGNFQKEFTHEIPIEKKIKEKRISFTFRYHKN